jgi:hypothetical protein
LHEFGIDYLAGVEISDPDLLHRTVAEGGGKRIFSKGLRYRIAELTPDLSMSWLKREIADCADEKALLTLNMENWYGQGNRQRFPAYTHLERINARLSRLDSSYKLLWDSHGESTRNNPTLKHDLTR